MIPLRRGAFGALPLAFLLGAFASPSVRAQDVPAPVAAPDVQTRTFQVHNVKPSLMAFWLDPAHQPMPVDIQYGSRFNTSGGFAIKVSPLLPVTPTGANPYLNAPMPADITLPTPIRLPGNANGPVGLKLPPGIERIVAIDSQNQIVVTGTSEGLKALGNLLPTIDVPLVQYEVAASFYQLDRKDLPQTGLKFQLQPDESSDYFGSATAVPFDFDRRITKLVKTKRALLLTEPRVTVIDGLSGQLIQSTITPAVWNEISTLPRLVDAPTNVQTPQRIAFITTSIGIRASVTRMEGGLIDLAVEPRLGTRILSVQATVREDQPFAIQMSPGKDKRQIIVVVTPRRIRRMGDDT